jgi:hypothetical protein
MEAPNQKMVVKVLGQDVVLDPDNMRYSDATLNDYLQKEYGWIDYFGKQLELAQKEALYAELEADALYSKAYTTAKDANKADFYAKALASSDPAVIEAKKFAIDRKEVVGHIKAHLKAWDKNHSNVQNRGHTLRKEMSKLNNDILEDTCSIDDWKKDAGL